MGLVDMKSDSEFISQKIKERISPFPEVVMKLHKTEDGKELLLLQIPAGAETPYYYTGDGVTEAYIRIGNESVVADATELKRLVMRGKNSSNYQSGMEPTFRSNRVEFTVKLPNLNFKASNDEALNEALNEALTENQKLLLDILRNNPTITQKEIISNTSLSRSTVQRAIKELIEMGQLERVGSKKIGSWIVKN